MIVIIVGGADFEHVIQETNNQPLEKTYLNVQDNWTNLKGAGLQRVLELARQESDETQQKTR